MFDAQSFYYKGFSDYVIEPTEEHVNVLTYYDNLQICIDIGQEAILDS